MFIIKMVDRLEQGGASLKLLSRAHAQGVKQSVCPSVVVVIVIVVVDMKITRSLVIGICACCKHNQSVKKLVRTPFKLLKMTY